MIICSPKDIDTYSILKLDGNYDYLTNYEYIIAAEKNIYICTYNVYYHWA